MAKQPPPEWQVERARQHVRAIVRDRYFVDIPTIRSLAGLYDMTQVRIREIIKEEKQGFGRWVLEKANEYHQEVLREIELRKNPDYLPNPDPSLQQRIERYQEGRS